MRMKVNKHRTVFTHGFTLLEVLVVLLIMGMLVGMVSVIARPDEQALLRLEAERLSQLLELAASEARVSGQSFAWEAEQSSYHFSQQGVQEPWTPVNDNDLLRPRTLPPGMVISGVSIENTPLDSDFRIEFTAYSAVLVFLVEISTSTQRYLIAGSPVGELRIMPGESLAE